MTRGLLTTQETPPTINLAGGVSRVISYADSSGVRFVVHEVTNRAGTIIHRDFDAVRIASGQIINAPRTRG